MWFRKKKEVNVLYISGQQLAAVLQKGLSLVEEDVRMKFYVCSLDILFEYQDEVYTVTVGYDKKSAKQDGCISFSPVYLYLEQDGVRYGSLNEWKDRCVICRQYVRDILSGIVLYPEFASLLDVDK